jgi:hypothetical protein
MEATEEDVEQKLKEVLLIVNPDAVIDPWAVVVHARDARAAR